MLTAVDGQSITYDGSGNPLSYYNGYRYTFAWEQGRQLDSLTYNGHTTSYQYNHDGIRTKKVKSDGSYVVYDIVDGTAVGETHYTSAGTATMYMMYIHDENGAVNGIGLWYPGNTEWTYYYFVKNLQGDVLEIYGENHSCVASYTYDSWGNILSKSGSLADINPFRYRGYYFDNESWFYYLQSRYYDPAIGRFINADNADLLGANGDFASLNLFAYCGNNPVLRADNNGHFWNVVIGAAVGAVVGAVTQIASNAIKGDNLLSGVGMAAAVGGVGGAIAATSWSAPAQAIVTSVVSGTTSAIGSYAGAKLFKGVEDLGNSLIQKGYSQAAKGVDRALRGLSHTSYYRSGTKALSMGKAIVNVYRGLSSTLGSVIGVAPGLANNLIEPYSIH